MSLICMGGFRRSTASWREARPWGLAGVLASALVLGSCPVKAATGAQPSSPQPTVPQGVPGVSIDSPILGAGPGSEGRKPLVVRKKLRRAVRLHRHRARPRWNDEELERPALAGVELVAPLPHPMQPPHVIVPVPAYPLENFITFYTTPPPPVVCHRVPRDPYAPDPHLVYEKPVVCTAVNP